MTIQKATLKEYRCTKCGYIETQRTNHYGNTWSVGHYSTCPRCPPHAKYPEFGGATVWECVDKPEESVGYIGEFDIGEIDKQC